MENLGQLLARHPFFQGLAAEQIDLLAGCGRNAQFKDGQRLCRVSEPADEFFLIRAGSVRIEIPSPRLGPIAVETVHEGDILGWSWIIPPYRWNFDAQAMGPVRATALDGKCLRSKFATDGALGYAIMQRFAGILLQRLQATRLQFVEAVERAAEKGP